MSKKKSTNVPLKQLAQAISATLHGNESVCISGVNNPENALPGELAYLANHRQLSLAKKSKASAFIVSKHYSELHTPQLIVLNPQYSFVEVINQFFPQRQPARGIAQDILKGQDVHIGQDVSIGPFVTLSDRVKIGNRVTIYPGVFLGKNVKIGDDSILYPQVTIQEQCEVGNNVIIHAGSIVGSDGFGYVQYEEQHHKIPQLGNVVIEDHVELGANVTIDRATFGTTIIKQGCKIDNQVQIAHNVTIGEHSIIVAQVGIAGSTRLGKNVIVGGQAGLIDHLTIGDKAMIAAGAGIDKNVEPGAIMSGRPAKRHEVSLRTYVLVNRLPELHKQVAALEKRLTALESKKKTVKKSNTKKR